MSQSILFHPEDGGLCLLKPLVPAYQSFVSSNHWFLPTRVLSPQTTGSCLPEFCLLKPLVPACQSFVSSNHWFLPARLCILTFLHYPVVKIRLCMSLFSLLCLFLLHFLHCCNSQPNWYHMNIFWWHSFSHCECYGVYCSLSGACVLDTAFWKLDPIVCH
jgi:hypothetical protein